MDLIFIRLKPNSFRRAGGNEELGGGGRVVRLGLAEGASGAVRPKGVDVGATADQGSNGVLVVAVSGCVQGSRSPVVVFVVRLDVGSRIE